MKVLTLSLWPVSPSAIGGTERFVLDLIEAMKSHEISMIVATVSGISNTIGTTPCISLNLDRKGGSLDEFTLRRTFFRTLTKQQIMKFCARIENALPKERWDVLHATSLLFCGVLPQKPKVFSLHTIPQEFEQIFGKGSFVRIASLIREQTRKDTIFIAPSRFSLKIFQRSFQRKVIYIPHAFNKERLITSEPRHQILQDLGLRDAYFILNPTRLELVQKRQHLIIKALAEVKSSLPEFHLVLTGMDAPYVHNAKTLYKLANKNNVPLSLITLSPIDMAKLYKVANLVVLPSHYESFGYAALEALALGINTVLSDIPSFREIAKGNPHAYFWKGSVSMLGRRIVDATQARQKTNIPNPWYARYSIDSWSKRYAYSLKEVTKTNK